MNLPRLTEQKNLMLLAAGIAQEIETIETYVRPIDPVRATITIEFIMKSYAEAMARLMSVLPLPDMLAVHGEEIKLDADA